MPDGGGLGLAAPAPVTNGDTSHELLALPDGAKGIVFDCDGTLLDTMTLHWQSWQESCAHFELPITLPWWLAQAGKPADEILRLLCEMESLPIPAEFLRWKKERYVLNLLPKVQTIEPVVAVARAAKARGMPIAVASGGSTSNVRTGLASTGILHLFDAVVCAESSIAQDYKKSKPAPDCFLLAAERMGVAPEYCVGFEDAVLGMASIRAAGFMQAIDVTALPDYPVIEE